MILNDFVLNRSYKYVFNILIKIPIRKNKDVESKLCLRPNDAMKDKIIPVVSKKQKQNKKNKKNFCTGKTYDAS